MNSGKTLNQPGESVTIVDDKTKKKLDEIEPHGHDVGSSDRSSGKDRFKRSVEDDFDTAPSETANRVIHEDALHTLDAKRKGKLKDCRWDYEDYLMLCPNHNAVKLLRQQSKSRILGSEEKDYMPAQISYNSLKFWEKSPTGPKKWFFCGSALSSEETYLLANFASMCGATVSTCWKPKVTHVIAATNGKGACSRTSTFLLAILSGQWILTMDWVKGCIKENHPINEEPYEVKLDNHGCLNGPKNGRIRASTNAPKLFDGMKFFFSGDFVPAFKNELKYLVIFGGGAVYENLEEMLAFDSMEQKIGHRHKTRAIFFVYNHGSPQGSISEAASSSFRQILAKSEDDQSLVIPHTWLLETVAACNVPSLT